MKDFLMHMKQLPKKRLLVVGDVMVDEYLFGSVTRVSPEAPVPVVLEKKREYYLGGAANTAANAAHIGMQTSLVGLIGQQDVLGAKFLDLLDQTSLNRDGIIASDERLTTCKLRVLAQGQQCLRVDSESVSLLSDREQDMLIERLDSLIKPHMTVLISDYAKGVVTAEVIRYLVEKSRELQLTILVDPKGPNFLKYTGVDYIKPNFSEYKQIVAQLGLDLGSGIVINARLICATLQLKGLIVTMGEEGIWYIDSTTHIYSPACKREVFDLSGAGDTVAAFLALALSYDVPMEKALAMANVAASIAIAHVKTYAVGIDEVAEYFISDDYKVVHDWVILKKQLDGIKKQGKKIVFTNGCFDVLHVGHVQLLQKARSLGDILVVALNSDDSVRRLNKGINRPVNTLADRAGVIAALQSVDFVTSFNEDTPQEIIDILQPQVLVKGGDYTIESIVGAQTVLNAGGEVHVVDLVPGKSTTAILARAREQVAN